ncbi:unnamed protein product [Peronospora belbahrii]|uniref:DUF676 domain-containing protein n=1 Tax=Peronospora belbahrii TaxID=622444 RepID=A0ABN8CXL5_9STRA|nr:unnamed protein product [Peronospora belbahrii]
MWFQLTSIAFFVLLTLTTAAENALEEETVQERRLRANAKMWWIFGSSGNSKCKSKLRPCLFIHGENHENEEKELQDSSDKFGDMSKNAPCCSSIKYASLDTLNVGWTDHKLQKKVCGHALSMSEDSDEKQKIIKNTILVTHSMGALILAGAIANKHCSIDSSTSWVSMSAPMKGSMVSNYVQDVCTDDDTQVFHQILTLVGQCPVQAGMESLAYMDGKYSTKELNKAYVAAKKVYTAQVSAAMCSNGNIGIFSTYQAKYLLLGAKVDHGSGENDGFTTYKSCRGGIDKAKFGDDPSDRFYVTHCNHADTAFLNGDSHFKDSMKPVKWFKGLF